MGSIRAPSQAELDLADGLRQAAMEEIDRQGFAEAASRLGLKPTGVKALKARPRWSLEIAYRVAERLGVNPSIDVGRSLPSS